MVAVGTELLASGRIDRNTPLLKERLSQLGVAVQFSAVVPDERSIMEDTLRMALARCRYVVVCGGLGPTTDDLTRFAAASVLGVRLVEDAASLAGIESRFRDRGIEMPEVNRRQALIPEGAAALPNPAGTAPGVLARTGAGAWLVLLPGPPAELAAMFDAEVRPRLEAETDRTAGSVRETLMVAGLPESVLQERILDLSPARDAPYQLAILASRGRSRSGSPDPSDGRRRSGGSRTEWRTGWDARSSAGPPESIWSMRWDECSSGGGSAPRLPNRLPED